jgi:hypothetical protein
MLRGERVKTSVGGRGGRGHALLRGERVKKREKFEIYFPIFAYLPQPVKLDDYYKIYFAPQEGKNSTCSL